MSNKLKKTIVVGAGGHSHSVCDLILAGADIELVGIVDGYVEKAFWGIPHLGGDDVLEKIYAERMAEYAFVAIGANDVREKYHIKLQNIGYKLINIISSSAAVSPRAKIGQGVCIMPGACVNANAVIGDGVILNTNCSVDHDTVVSDHVHIAPGSTLCGGVYIGNNCFVGAGSTIINGIKIGKNVMIGAGAAVIKDIPDNCTAVGVPARIIKTY